MAFFSKPKYSKVVVKSREGVPKGVFTKCPETGDMVFAKELKKNLMVVPTSGYHFPLSAPDRIDSLVDRGSFVECDDNLSSLDPLNFKGLASYKDKLVQNRKKTSLEDAVISGIGKSGIIGKKISSTLASVGIPSFFVDAAACSHGDLGQISSNDVLILISFSGESAELKNIIQHAKRNKKITLIGIVSKKNSILYNSSDIKLLIPNVPEAGPGNIVPTSSTITQLSIGDALAVSTMNYRKFGKLDFKKFHPSGSLGSQLKTVEDLMITGKKIPFINENLLMKNALKIMSKKNLGVLIVKNSKQSTVGIITDGDLKRLSEKNENIKRLIVRKIMKPNPISVEKNMLLTLILIGVLFLLPH